VTPTSAAGRAYVASARAVLPPERERARAVCAVLTCASTQVSCSFGARGSHVEARPCTEGDGRSAGAVGFHRVWADCNQRGGARARRKRACCASSRERERARTVGAVLTCARTQVSCSFGARSSHVEAQPCTEGDGRAAGAVGFHGVWTDANQRGPARARRKRACCASSQERASARSWRSSDVRTHASQLLVWSTQLARQSTAVHRGRRPSHWHSGLQEGMS
jgi:hypothetical protein